MKLNLNLLILQTIQILLQSSNYHLYKSSYLYFKRQSIERSKETRKQLRQKINGYTASTLPTLYNEIAQLISTPVLVGDYNLKLARQCYHLSKQERVNYKFSFTLFIYCLVNCIAHNTMC